MGHSDGRSLGKTKMGTGAPTAAFTRTKTKYRSVPFDGKMKSKCFLPVKVVCYSSVSL